MIRTIICYLRPKGPAASALLIIGTVLMLASCISSAPVATPTVVKPTLIGHCEQGNNLQAGITGDVAYVLGLTNPGSQPVQVSGVAVIFTGDNGQQISSDDPAQQNFPGDAYPINNFNMILIDAGQTIYVDMETDKISGAAGNWSCSLGGWWS